MKYAFLVALREYAESAKAKGFWVSLFLIPAILMLSIQAPIWLEQKATPVRHFVLVDQSGTFKPVVESALEKAHQKRVLEALKDYARKNSLPSAASLLREFDDDNRASLDTFTARGGKTGFLEQLQPHLKPGSPSFSDPRRLFQAVNLPADINPNTDLSVLAADLKPYLRGAKQIQADEGLVELRAAILIPRDIEKQIVRPTSAPNVASGVLALPAPIQYWSVNTSDSKLRDEIETAINAELRRREYLARGMDGAVIRQVERTYAPFATLNPKKEKGKEAVGTTDVIRQWLPSGFVYLLWLSIFVIIQMLLNNTIEEKSNRIIEVLLSSVTPGELMMGKLFGIAAVGLTMVGAWMLSLFGILSWHAGGASLLAGQILAILKASNLVPLFTVYFILGYLMYAAFILSIGSVCNSIKEAQSYMGVLTLIMMVPMLTMTFIPKDPNGPLARLLSWIPIYSPFTMMNRAAADPPLVDLVGTLVMMLATTALALWMAGKVFRIGVLRTGQPPKVLEMLRWAIRRET
jgi:ABC-2 type transport system permease protein